MCWKRFGKYFPYRIKRRNLCFCKVSRRRLVKILESIHDTHCSWRSQSLSNLDEVTKKCISVIVDGTQMVLNCEDLDAVIVGSSAEGMGKPYVLELEKGYRDPMCRFLLRFFCFCLPCNTAYSSLRTDIDVILRYPNGGVMKSTFDPHTHKFRIKELFHKPGFVNVLLNENGNARSWEVYCQQQTKNFCLSSEMVKFAVLDAINTVDERSFPSSRIFGPFKHPPVAELEMKGPAVKVTLFPIGQVWYWNENQKFVTFEGDFVFGIHCHQPWPRCSLNWLSRRRNWPSASDVKHVSQSGFILVAKQSASTSNNDFDNSTEWLVSFPHSEAYLSQRVPVVAKACFLALKIIFKDHLSYHCENLKTYQLKTTLFWELERQPTNFWRIQNIENCFLNILDKFIEFVKSGYCPNYWIENHNLFHSCKNGELEKVLHVLKYVRHNPAPYIGDIGSMWC